MSEDKGVLHKTIHSSKWVVLGSVTSKVIGLVSFLVLARLLDPTSYGFIAIALMIVGVFNRMLVTGFETAVIQRKGDTDKYLDAVWTFNIIKALVVFGLIYAAGPAIAEFFHATAAINVIRWSGLFVLIPALSNIKQLYLFKDFKFNKLYYRDLYGQVAYVVIGALYAIFISADVWALFYANLAKYTASALTIYYFFPQLPKFILKFGVLKDLIPYSKWITAQNFVNYFLSIIDNVLIGRLLSVEILGLYTKGRNLAGTAMSFIANMLKNLSFVAFSKVQDEKAKIRKGFLMGFDLILFIGMANIFVIWFGGEAIIQLLLGEKWIGIVPALKIFTVFGLTNGVLSLVYSLFDGAGKPSVNFKLKVAGLFLYAILSYIGIKYKSMVGAAIGISLSSFIMMLYALLKLSKVYNIKFRVLINHFIQIALPIVITTVLIIPVLAVYNLSTIMTLGVVAVFSALFLILFWLFGRQFKQGCSTTILLVINSLRKT